MLLWRTLPLPGNPSRAAFLFPPSKPAREAGTRRVTSTYDLQLCPHQYCKVAKLVSCGVELLQLVWIETPTNPTLKVIDIRACAEVVHKHKDVLLVVDNTFMSAYFQVSAWVSLPYYCHVLTVVVLEWKLHQGLVCVL